MKKACVVALLAPLLFAPGGQEMVGAAELLPIGTGQSPSPPPSSTGYVTWEDVEAVYLQYDAAYRVVTEAMNDRNIKLQRRGSLLSTHNPDATGKIYDLRRMTTKEDLDAAAAEIIKAFPGEYERGQVMYKQAQRSLLLGFEGADQAAREAMEYSLWPSQEINLHRLRGQQAEGREFPPGSPEFAPLRRQAATAYLEGLRVSVELPKWPELPPLVEPNVLERTMFDNPSPAETAEVQRQRALRAELMENAEAYQGIRQRTQGWDDYLKERVVAWYTQKPYHLDEFEKLAHDILRDPGLERELTKRIRDIIRSSVAASAETER